MIEQLHMVGKEADARAIGIDEARKLPADLVDMLLQSGVIRLWVAQRYGGMQQSALAFAEAIEQLAYYNGSLAWVAMVTGTSGYCSGFLAPEAAAEIFSDPMGMTGGASIPMGTAVQEKNGLRVNGRWMWGSGTPHCDWILGVAHAVDCDGNPSPLADGTRMPLFYFPAEKAILHDTWRVSGMKGTASGEYEVRNLFVPDGYWFAYPPPRPVLDETLYCFSFGGASAIGVAAVALGLAQRALDELKELGPNKAPRWSTKKLAERPSIQIQLAEAEARYLAARAFLHQAIDTHWQEAEARKVSLETRRRLRMAATFATHEAAKVVDVAYNIGGGSSIWESVPLQRIFRDVHVTTQHGVVSPQTLEMAGRMGFGLPVVEPMV